MPWEGKYRYFKQPSGISPHTLLLGHIRGLKASFEAMPAKIETMMDKSGSCGESLIDQIVRAVGEASQHSAMSNYIISIKQMIEDMDVARETAGNRQHQTQRGSVKHMRLLGEFKHGNDDYRRVPSTWKFPSLSLQPMHTYWHCGNNSETLSPMKFLEPQDLVHMGTSALETLSKIGGGMAIIDNSAKKKA